MLTILMLRLRVDYQCEKGTGSYDIRKCRRHNLRLIERHVDPIIEQRCLHPRLPGLSPGCWTTKNRSNHGQCKSPDQILSNSDKESTTKRRRMDL